VNIATKSNELFEPDWQINLVNICSRISQSTLAASFIPKLIQEFYENCFFEDRIKVNNKIIKKYPDLTRKFVQDIMQFLNKVCGIDSKIFQDFMTL
jgi:hypothetical protein